jgi:hypothetical protein
LNSWDSKGDSNKEVPVRRNSGTSRDRLLKVLDVDLALKARVEVTFRAVDGAVNSNTWREFGATCGDPVAWLRIEPVCEDEVGVFDHSGAL